MPWCPIPCMVLWSRGTSLPNVPRPTTWPSSLRITWAARPRDQSWCAMALSCLAMPSLDDSPMTPPQRSIHGFIAGTLIGTLGGLIGLGGAEFRLPVLVGLFRLGTLEAVILNKAMSLVVVAAALLFRLKAIHFEQLGAHIGVALNLLAGSLVGAWWAAGHAITMSRVWRSEEHTSELQSQSNLVCRPL